MSFKLFTQVSEVTKPPPVGADPCVCPTPKGVTLRLNRWNMSFRHWADTWVRPYNREVTALPKLKLLYNLHYANRDIVEASCVAGSLYELACVAVDAEQLLDAWVVNHVAHPVGAEHIDVAMADIVGKLEDVEI